MKLKGVLLTGFLFILFFTTAPIEGAQYKYVGAKKCKTCHKKKSLGNQYGIWKKRKHSKAFLTVGTEAKECAICHIPALYDKNGDKRDKSLLGRSFKKEDGVQCEDCHGPGEKYKSSKIMKKIASEGGAENSSTAKQTGLLTSSEKTCGRCHAEKIIVGGKEYKNPTFKEFNFKEAYKKVLHPKP